MNVKIPEQKVIEMSKQLVHNIRTNVSGEVDSKGKFKPKVTVEISRETEDGQIDSIKTMVLEQLNLSREVIEQKVTEMLLNMNGNQ